MKMACTETRKHREGVTLREAHSREHGKLETRVHRYTGKRKHVIIGAESKATYPQHRKTETRRHRNAELQRHACRGRGGRVDPE
jgi:hypothetical protein